MVKVWRASFTSSGGSSTSPTGGFKKYKPIKDDGGGSDRKPPLPKSAPKPPKVVKSTPVKKVKAKKENKRKESDADSIVNEIEVEIEGLSLLEERDNAIHQVQQANKIMYFHALQLIRKQMYWLDLELDASVGTTNSEAVQRKKKVLEELEGKIERASFEGSASLPPNKALFKVTTLLDDTIQSLSMGKQNESQKSDETVPVPGQQDRLLSAGTLVEFYPENDSCSDVYCDSEKALEEDVDAEDQLSEKGEGEEEARDAPVTDYDEWMNAFDQCAEEFVGVDHITKDVAPKSVADATEIAEMVATQSIAENNPFTEGLTKDVEKQTKVESNNVSDEPADIMALKAIATTEDIPFPSDPFPDMEQDIKGTTKSDHHQEDTTSKTESDTTGGFEASRIEI